MLSLTTFNPKSLEEHLGLVVKNETNKEKQKEEYDFLYEGYAKLGEAILRLRQEYRYDNNKFYRTVIHYTKEHLNTFFLPKVFRVIDYYETPRVQGITLPNLETVAKYFTLCELLLAMNSSPLQQEEIHIPYLWTKNKAFLEVFSYFKLHSLIAPHGECQTIITPLLRFNDRKKKFGVSEEETFREV